MMNNFDQDDLMLADLSTDYNPDDIIDHINVNELIYSSCNNFAPWTGPCSMPSAHLYVTVYCLCDWLVWSVMSASLLQSRALLQFLMNSDQASCIVESYNWRCAKELTNGRHLLPLVAS